MDDRLPEERRPEEVSGDKRTTADLTEAAADGLRWVAYARVAVELLLVGAMVLLARMIPPAAFGVFAVVAIVQELAMTMPMEGVGGAIVQRREVAREHLQAGLALNLVISFALIGVVSVLALLVVQPLFGRDTAMLVIAATPLFPLGGIYAIPMAVLRRRLEFRRISLIEVTMSATRALAAVGLAFLGLDASALVFGGVAAMVVAVILATVFAPPPHPRWQRSAVRDLLPYGGPAALATVAWTGFRNGDYVIIGSVLGTAQAGFYWRGYQLAVEYQTKVASVMTQIAFPVLSRTAGMAELMALRQRMVQLLTVTIFPLLGLLLLLAPVAVPWLFGSAWAEAVTPTQILVVGGAATLVINACGSALMAAGRARTLLGYGVGHFVVYAGAVLFVAHLGLTAVAIAGSVVHAIFLVVAYVVLLKDQVHNPVRVLWQDIAPASLASAALLAVGLPADISLDSLGMPAVLQMGGVILAGGVAYLLALRLWFPASARDLGAAIRRIVPNRIRVPRLRRAILAES
jgi:O-antigen/teichoic acid export membrane protein